MRICNRINLKIYLVATLFCKNGKKAIGFRHNKKRPCGLFYDSLLLSI